jgi:hypothetical protein
MGAAGSDHNLSGEDAICLRELDHLQAIVGRYDQFFFWYKNICLLGIGGGVALRAAGHFELWPVAFLPLLFFIAECTFRQVYWRKFISRIREIADYLNRNSTSPFRLYALASAEAESGSFPKAYDILFYAVVLIAILLLVIADCHGLIFR